VYFLFAAFGYSLHSACLSAVWRACNSPKSKLVFRNVADVLFYISPSQSIILSIYFVSCSLFHRGAVCENKEIPDARQHSLGGNNGSGQDCLVWDYGVQWRASYLVCRHVQWRASYLVCRFVQWRASYLVCRHVQWRASYLVCRYVQWRASYLVCRYVQWRASCLVFGLCSVGYGHIVTQTLLFCIANFQRNGNTPSGSTNKPCMSGLASHVPNTNINN
jgi:hypothetical protein